MKGHHALPRSRDDGISAIRALRHEYLVIARTFRGDQVLEWSAVIDEQPGDRADQRHGDGTGQCESGKVDTGGREFGDGSSGGHRDLRALASFNSGGQLDALCNARWLQVL